MTTSPKVALVHDWLTGFTGAEQVLLALHEMYPDAPIYTSLWNPEKTTQLKDAKIIPSYLQNIPGLVSRHQLAVPLTPLAFESFNLKGYDVVISTTTGFSKGVITQPDQTHISYCHTPPRYLWHMGGDNRAEGWLRSRVSHGLRIWDYVSAQRVDQFVANSKTVAGRINKIYRKPAEVIYPPVDTKKFQLSTEKPGDYFLSVSRLITYKRIDLIVQACKMTKQPLKVVSTGPEEDKLRAIAEGAPWIEFTGRVSDEELKRLYSGARAFLFAAEEDFGIVPVEAMSTGRPVIAFGKGGATESVKEGVTGTFFYEQTAESLAAVLEQFKDEEWDPKVIRAHAEQFDTEVFKKKMRDLVESTLKRRHE